MIRLSKIERLSLLSRAAISVFLLAAALQPVVASAELLKSFVYPLLSARVSSSFGGRKHPIRRYVKHHNGVDLAAPKGTPIRVVSDGVVVFADRYAGYGNLVVVRHKQDYTTHYGHCDKINVRPGQKVKAGTIIGLVGSTGLSNGPHLHFEIRQGGKALDPERLVPHLTSEAAG